MDGWAQSMIQTVNLSHELRLSRCLFKYDYQQRMCAKEVEALVRCCRTLPRTPLASVHCQGFAKSDVPAEGVPFSSIEGSS